MNNNEKKPKAYFPAADSGKHWQKITSIGIILSVTGLLLLAALITLLLRFGVGTSQNPPLPSPTADVVNYFLSFATLCWFLFLFAGIALIIVSFIARKTRSRPHNSGAVCIS